MIRLLFLGGIPYLGSIPDPFLRNICLIMNGLFRNLMHGQMKHHLLFIVVLLWVALQINAAFSATDPVMDQVNFGGVDIRSIEREPDAETLLPVADRTFSDFEPKGLIVSHFIVLPSLGVGYEYNDNLYASETNEEADMAFVVSPGLSIQKQKDKNYISAQLESEIVRYLDNTNENLENYSLDVNGAYELRHDLILPYGIGYERYHQDRADNLSRVFTKEPLSVTDLELTAGVAYKPNRFGLNVNLNHLQKTFEDGVSFLDPSRRVINSDANYETNQVEVRASYELPVNHTVFASGVYGSTKYDKAIFDEGAQTYTSTFRDAKTLGALLGLTTKYKGLVSAEIGVGYAAIDFDNPTLSDVENVAIDAELDYNVTRLSSIGLDLTRRLVQDNEIIQGIVQTNGTLSLDHELRRYLVLNAQASYTNRDYDGINREDDVYNLGLGFTYRPSPYYNIQGRYVYSTQDSNFAGNDFDRNLFMLRLTGTY